MYRSHDMRHTGFRRLMVVNGTPGFGESHHLSPKSARDEMQEKVRVEDGSFLLLKRVLQNLFYKILGLYLLIYIYI